MNTDNTSIDRSSQSSQTPENTPQTAQPSQVRETRLGRVKTGGKPQIAMGGKIQQTGSGRLPRSADKIEGRSKVSSVAEKANIENKPLQEAFTRLTDGCENLDAGEMMARLKEFNKSEIAASH